MTAAGKACCLPGIETEENFKTVCMKRFFVVGLCLLKAFCCSALTFSLVGTPPGYVNVKEYGATGDGVTDDTAAIRAVFQICKTVYFPAGVYVLTDGIDLPKSAVIQGAGTPALAPFPLVDDDKRFLRAGSVTNLPGTTLLFKGAGVAEMSTGRQDAFHSMRYALKTHADAPFSISDLGIVLDVQVFNESGQLTTLQEDQSADYDTGLLIDDSPSGSVRNVAVFGYWNKAGLCVVSRGEGGTPDYNSFWNCSFMGEHGVALVGSDTVAGPGLSGTRFYGCDIFAGDHHSRGAAWGTTALYIDGMTGSNSSISGHSFFGGCIRTYLNDAVQLDHASNVSFFGTVFELPSWTRDGVDSSRVNGLGRVVATANTRDLSFIACRHLGLGFTELGQAMTKGQMFVVNDQHSSVAHYSDGQAVRMMAVPGYDPLVQFTDNPDSVNSGWTIRMDTSDGNALKFRYNNSLRSTIETE